MSIELTVKVISGSASPFGNVNCTFTIPEELGSGISSYQAFYINKHQGRKLTWVYAKSRGDIQYRCPNGKNFVFTASVFQMAIMLLFNRYDEMSIEDIQKNTDIKVELLVQILKIFLKVKLLLCVASTKDESELKATDVMKLNTNYKNKKLRININVPIKTVDKEDDERTHRQIDESRKFVIEAAIVRIMKMRKSLKHQELVGEVLNHIGAKFSPTVPMIKKGIEELIQREYLERDATTRDVLNYLA
ncbi:unnamed protein product [Medioppia subpectinata]|nr:unnamed protein product [Medioppia subpectinata]CAG2119509.1 unnamed protein product [Medioppia subpectinata]